MNCLNKVCRGFLRLICTFPLAKFAVDVGIAHLFHPVSVELATQIYYLQHGLRKRYAIESQDEMKRLGNVEKGISGAFHSLGKV